MPVEKGIKIELFRFFEILLYKFVRNDFKCCCKPTTYIFMKVLDFDILPKNVFNQSECRIF